MTDISSENLKIIETIGALSVIPGISSQRGVTLEEVMEKLKLSDRRDYTDRLEELRISGFIQVSSTGWAATLTAKGRRFLKESIESSS